MKAVIFDMNGVIIDDERVHQESWRVYTKKHNIHISEDEFKHNIFGRTEKDTFEYIHKREISPEELNQLSDERVDTAVEIFKPHMKLADGLLELLQNLYDQHTPLGIATSSRSRYVNLILDGLHIRKFFSAVTTADEISHGKPDPEIYLATAEKLQIDPKNCVVFEDTLSGINSAQAAGMKVVGIASTHESHELELADMVIKSFTEVSPELLHSF